MLIRILKINIFLVLSLNLGLAQDIDQLVDDGLAKVFSLEFEQAEHIFDKVIAQEPENPRGYFFKSAVYFWMFTRNFRSEKIGKQFIDISEQAIEIGEERLDVNEDDIDAMFYLGGIYGNLGRYYAIKKSWINAYWYGRKGKNYLEEVVEINPQYYDAYLGLGIYHYYADILPRFIKAISFILGIDGDKQRGIAEIELAIEKGTFTRNEGRFFLGMIYLRFENKHEKALKLYQELVNQFPDNPAFMMAVGWAYIRMDRDAEALELFKKVLTYDQPNYRLIMNQTHYFCGNIYFKQNNFEQAAYHFASATEKSPDEDNTSHWTYFRSLIRYGKSLELAGKREQAENIYMQINEDNSERFYNEAQQRLQNPYSPFDKKMIIADNHRQTAKYDSALTLYNQLLKELKETPSTENNNNEAKIYHNSGLVHYQKKNYNEAIYRLQKVLILVDEQAWINSWTYLYLGNAYRDSGNKEEAKHYYGLALETDSRRVKSRAEQALSKM